MTHTMAGEKRDIDLFAIPDYWKTSTWLDQVASSDSTPFFPVDVTSKYAPLHSKAPAASRSVEAGSIEYLGSSLLNPTPQRLPEEGFFRLPPLRILNADFNDRSSDTETSQPGSALFQATEKPSRTSTPASEIWLDLPEHAAKVVGCRTWDTFTARTSPTIVPRFLSEAGPRVFDAFLSSSDSLQAQDHASTSVVRTQLYFSSLLALALRQESVLFHKNGGTYLKPVLPHMRLSGYSSPVLKGIEKQCHECGNLLTTLRSFTSTILLKPSSCSCAIAIASAIDQMLLAAQQHISVDGRNPKSLLTLSQTVSEAHSVLAWLHKMTSQLKSVKSDRDVLSSVHSQIYQAGGQDGTMVRVARELLCRVSQPWIDQIDEWIGTKKEVGVPLLISQLGRTKGFIKVEEETVLDDFGQEIPHVDFRLAANEIPQFMAADTMQTVFDTGKNIRFIRSSHPSHPLADNTVIASCNPPMTQWLYDWNSILALERRLQDYQNTLRDVVAEYHDDAYNTPCLVNSSIGPIEDHTSPTFHCADEELIKARLQDSIRNLDQPLDNSGRQDRLYELTLSKLRSDSDIDPAESDFEPHWSLLSSLSFGGIASTQASLINSETVRLLFANHDLRKHLELQRDFQLFDNGIFCSRLSHALFDPDYETAERQAGVALAGGTMGLRLGSRDTWPPASSELRLALMGVLSDSYTPHHSSPLEESADRSWETHELPGDLSFAVRDLSPEEIDRCMDPDSLEALDFLRLSYKSPPELSGIITPTNLSQYDRIFKHMLRVTRLLFVVNQLFQDLNIYEKSGGLQNAATYRFVAEARHFVAGIASYFMDVGIRTTWGMFSSQLQQVESDSNNIRDARHTKEQHSPTRLAMLHTAMLDQISQALFLRKRQQPVLKLLEDIFTTILGYAKFSRSKLLSGLEKGQETKSRELYTDFRKKVRIFLTVCRGLTEKHRGSSSKTQNAEDAVFKADGIGEDSTIAMLLMKLDMFEYYFKH